MKWNDNSFSPALFREDVVATLYPGKNPPLQHSPALFLIPASNGKFHDLRFLLVRIGFTGLKPDLYSL